MPNYSTAGKQSQAQRVLEKRAHDLAQALREQGDPAGSLNTVTFTLGKEKFGIELKYLKEVQPLDCLNWSLVPCTPEFVVGVVNIRGRLYSVMDLASFLGLRGRHLTEQSHVLLVRVGGQGGGPVMELGLISDTLPVINRIGIEGLQEPQGTVSEEAQRYFKGVTAEMTTLLNMESLLSDPAIIVDWA
ncbi:MAG: chemotaxis protein CheW [Proteobacteria bacterium]|nr:chemotaxis protein CheW [Pseudomonadota bacterium]MBU1451313.1 chemotaxis protein CheW [Pseudomonadota bacterium]MBU2470173.1 chemotaxis protein CheW [Pseudomonadota bacterium]MBU2518098.1 chemotaxis protein CheW [Pseudomonadota bacterium]